MFLNLSLIKFNKKNYKAYRLKYIDENQLYSLRDKYNSTNSFFKHGEFIFHVPMEENECYTDGEIINLSVETDFEITKNFVHHAIFRRVFKDNPIFEDFKSIKFFYRNREKNDLLDGIVDKEVKNKLAYWRGYKMDTRILDSGVEKSYAVIFNIFYEWKIKVSCKELVSNYINIIGRFAIINNSTNIFIYNKLIGEIVGHTDTHVQVKKNDLIETYPIESVYLENSFDNREVILNYLIGEDKTRSIINHLQETSQSRKGGKQTFNKIKAIHDHFSKGEFYLNKDLSFSIGGVLSDKSIKWNSTSIPKTNYIFNVQGNHSSTWNDGGLREYGPYSQYILANNKPTIVVICRKDTKGDITNFVGKFLHGISISNQKSNSYQPFNQGFINKYRLEGCNTIVYEVEDESIKQYDKAVRRAIEENSKIDIAIIESCSRFKTLSNSENPYYIVKAKLLQAGIPSQVILYENVLLNDNRLAYILNNFSLATYAKLGGIPWLTPYRHNIDHELVIGIGNKVFKRDRFSIEKRIVGITTLFSGDGNYEFSSTSKDVPFEDYLDELLLSLNTDIKRIRERDNWQSNDTIRLIFHTFKPFSNDEIKVIENLVRNLQSDFNLEFSYLTISQAHPFLMFDENQKGVVDYLNYGKYKGEYQPIRTSNIQIDNYKWLLQLVGPNEVKSYRHGLASPVLIKLHEQSTFVSMSYLVKQIYLFSSISWRGFMPSSNPITLEYSSSIADILGNLREVPNWDSTSLLSMKYKAWFL